MENEMSKTVGDYPKDIQGVKTKNVFKLTKEGANPANTVGRMGFLRSSLRNPVSISYKGEGLILAPQGRVDQIDKEHLGALCTGVKFVPYKPE
jgi:hypothetical protein